MGKKYNSPTVDIINVQPARIIASSSSYAHVCNEYCSLWRTCKKRQKHKLCLDYIHSIETMDYKKAYEEAFERARKLATDLPNGRNDRLYHVDDLEYIFPELIESKDENMIKYIKQTLENLKYTKGSTADIERNNAIVWLESIHP